ncbi:unnamed protein product [Adineta ricciae]|uniref:Uncharacterized protein n=1 Tax=Adineta ricciae TaxID=249248 RepID=A0A815FW11_ADIRI|nr:unnamed protein product [Adineta ricciae]CAF1438849.1 unnamed protein product [Adineta ricciae]
MFYTVLFFVLLSLISTPSVDALLCAKDCRFTADLKNPTPPTCTYVDLPVSEQSCQVVLTVDYYLGVVNGIMNAKTPATVPNFDAVTVFSLASEATNLTIEFDCTDADRCDFNFTSDLLKSDWNQFLTQAKNIRQNLVDMLINPATLDSNDTCSAGPACSGKGFCGAVYQVWSDAQKPVYSEYCVNATNQPIFEWVQAYDQLKTGELMLYNCNKDGCTAVSMAENIARLLNRNYILPFNVLVPPSTSTTTSTPSPTQTSPPSAANFVRFDNISIMIFTFTSILFFYLS